MARCGAEVQGGLRRDWRAPRLTGQGCKHSVVRSFQALQCSPTSSAPSNHAQLKQGCRAGPAIAKQRRSLLTLSRSSSAAVARSTAGSSRVTYEYMRYRCHLGAVASR